mgnify:CR=1 FL=1
MLRRIFSLRTQCKRNFSTIPNSLKDIIEYKKTKIPIQRSDELLGQDLEEISKIANVHNFKKLYLRLQNDWKNNLIRKQKRHIRRVESQQALPEVTTEDPKFILHR